MYERDCVSIDYVDTANNNQTVLLGLACGWVGVPFLSIIPPMSSLLREWVPYEAQVCKSW